MVKSMIRTAVLILAVSGAQIGAAQTPADIITITPGVEQTLSIRNVDGASVGNINIIQIQRLSPNEVIIRGTGVGETSLELSQRAGQKRIMTIRVTRAPQTRARTSGRPIDQTLIGPEASPVRPTLIGGASLHPDTELASPTRNTEQIVNEDKVNIAASGTKTNFNATPIEVAPKLPLPPPAIEQPHQNQSFISRFQVSAETVFLSDKEEIRVVSPELVKALKLGQTVSGVENMGTLSQTDQVMTVRRSSIVTPVSILYEINPRNMLTVILPYIRRRDEVTVGGNSFRTKGQGLGDVQMKFERLYPSVLRSPWEGSLAVDLGLPTGKSIYNAASTESPLGTGHYEMGTTFGLYRVFDPFTFNAGVGANYSIPKVVQGARISPGLGFSLQTGLGFALNDRWVLSEQLNYRRQPNAFLSSPIDDQTVSSSQSSLTHSLSYSPRGDHGLRMMFNLGLNPSSPDYGFGVAYSYRRKTKVRQ